MIESIIIGFKLKSKKYLKIWGRSGSGGPNWGSIRVRLALRLRISSDFSVSSCFGHVQSTIIGKKKGTSIQKQLLNLSSKNLK